MKIADHTTEVLNGLLQGEISAIETYSKAIHSFPESGSNVAWRSVREEHLRSASLLRNIIIDRGGEPSTHSAVWPAVVKVLEGDARHLDPEPVIDPLIKGEERGVRDYEIALDDEDMEERAKQTMRSELLPRLRHHLQILGGLKEG